MRIPVDRWNAIPMHERIRWLAAGPFRDSGETLIEYTIRLVRLDPDLDAETADDLAFVLDGLYDRLTAGTPLPGYLGRIARERRDARDQAEAALEEARETGRVAAVVSALEALADRAESDVIRAELSRIIEESRAEEGRT